MPMILLATPGWAKRIKHQQHIKSGYAKTGAIWKPGLLKILRAGGISMKRMHQVIHSSNIATVLKGRLILPRSSNSLETRKKKIRRRGVLIYAQRIHVYEHYCLIVSLIQAKDHLDEMMQSESMLVS